MFSEEISVFLPCAVTLSEQENQQKKVFIIHTIPLPIYRAIAHAGPTLYGHAVRLLTGDH